MDREQTRRDAEAALSPADDEVAATVEEQELAHRCLTLLAELEQAELDREHGQRLLEVERHDREQAERQAVALEEKLVIAFDQRDSARRLQHDEKVLREQAERERDEQKAWAEQQIKRGDDEQILRKRAERERDEAISACVGDIELEQAIRERDEAREEADQLDNRLDLANLRLAKVPPLVEAANELLSYYRDADYPERTTDRLLEAEEALLAVLAAWEQE